MFGSNHSLNKKIVSQSSLLGFTCVLEAPTHHGVSVSGHKKESTFLRYVKLTKEESLKELSDLITT